MINSYISINRHFYKQTFIYFFQGKNYGYLEGGYVDLDDTWNNF